MKQSMQQGKDQLILENINRQNIRADE